MKDQPDNIQPVKELLEPTKKGCNLKKGDYIKHFNIIYRLPNDFYSGIKVMPDRNPALKYKAPLEIYANRLYELANVESISTTESGMRIEDHPIEAEPDIADPTGISSLLKADPPVTEIRPESISIYASSTGGDNIHPNVESKGQKEANTKEEPKSSPSGKAESPLSSMIKPKKS